MVPFMLKDIIIHSTMPYWPYWNTDEDKLASSPVQQGFVDDFKTLRIGFILLSDL
jgi:hypothetical protein